MTDTDTDKKRYCKKKKSSGIAFELDSIVSFVKSNLLRSTLTQSSVKKKPLNKSYKHWFIKLSDSIKL